jgi:hypothetical protein
MAYDKNKPCKKCGGSLREAYLKLQRGTSKILYCILCNEVADRKISLNNSAPVIQEPIREIKPLPVDNPTLF